MGDKTQGGGVKKFLFNKKTKTIGGRVKGAKMGSKDLITYVDKPTMVRGARVGTRRLARRQARQAQSKRKNRYVIKVIRLKQGRGYGS